MTLSLLQEISDIRSACIDGIFGDPTGVGGAARVDERGPRAPATTANSAPPFAARCAGTSNASILANIIGLVMSGGFTYIESAAEEPKGEPRRRSHG